MRVYYNGDFGDLGNVDFHNAQTHEQLRDVTAIDNVRVSQHAVMTCTLTWGGPGNERRTPVEIVRAPNVQRNCPDPHMVGRELFALKLRKERDAVYQCDTFTAELEQVSVGNDGRVRSRPDIPRWAIRKQIDDYVVAQGYADQIVGDTINHMGAEIGRKLMQEVVSGVMLKPVRPPGLDPTARAYTGQRYDAIIADDPEPEEEPTEGDLLMEFFSKRSGE